MYKKSRCLWSAPIFLLSLLVLFDLGCGSGTTGSGGGGGGTLPSNPKEWTWVSGSNKVGAGSVYGTQGTASSANGPGARQGAASWIDGSGNLWLFGSGTYGASTVASVSNDLWKFSPSSNEWTWVSGSSTASGSEVGVYGTKGTPANSNVPGGRSSAVSWIDSSGNLWLFGGDGYDSIGRNYLLNDLWEFNPSTQQWIWVSGSDQVLGKANYGVLGVAASTNVPGARQWAVSWKDGNGNFWLFGGQGNDAIGGSGSFNDLWEFSPTTQQWTWMSGGTGINAAGVYGALGVAASGNVPGARSSAVSWTDSSGNFWLFGGLGYDSTGIENDLNDLWEFSPSSKQWTWVGGSSTVTGGSRLCVPGVYGTQGTATATNIPGGRNGAVSWTDSSNNLWLFGGLGCDAADTPGALNDLWEFSTKTKIWTWQSGSNSVGPAQGGTGGPSGVYGTEGTAAASNMPGGRVGSNAWIDSSGKLWLFGGFGHDSTGASGELNDLWSYTP